MSAVSKAGWIRPSEYHATVLGVLSEMSLFKMGLDIPELQSCHLCGCSVDMPLHFWKLWEDGAELIAGQIQVCFVIYLVVIA